MARGQTHKQSGVNAPPTKVARHRFATQMPVRLWVLSALWSGTVLALLLISNPAPQYHTPSAALAHTPPLRLMLFVALWMTGIAGIVLNGRRTLQNDPNQMERALFRNSRETLERVLDTIPARVFWKDANSVYVGCNKVFAQDAGYESPSQVIGKTDSDLPWRELAERYCRDDREVVESGIAKLNYFEPQSRERGRNICLRSSKIPWRGPDGRILGVLGVYEDVTEQRRTEERVREQAELLDITQDAVTVLDLDGKVLYWNNAAEELYGWPVEEALGCSASTLFFGEVPPDFIQAVETVIKLGEWSGELRQVHREGKDLVVQSRATLVRDVAGEPKSMLFVSTDVTDRKALESKFLRVQRLETIGALASGVAHDLNNVLAPISMAVDMLRIELRSDSQQSLLQILATSVQRGAGSCGSCSHSAVAWKALVFTFGPTSWLKKFAA